MTAPVIQLPNGRVSDAARMVQLFTDDRVRRHLGGPKRKTIAWLLALASLVGARCGRRRWAQIICDARTGRMLGTTVADGSWAAVSTTRPKRAGSLTTATSS
ncbi:MAG TPA: hypothetical protein H9987_02405 [Candidatus Luteococcus avicola]|nr:hypothetical protein [Candidatus Luteococcus avicola]